MPAWYSIGRYVNTGNTLTQHWSLLPPGVENMKWGQLSQLCPLTISCKFLAYLLPNQHEKQRRPWHFSSIVYQQLKHCSVINIGWSQIQKTVHASYYKKNYPNKSHNKIWFPKLEPVICLGYATFQYIKFPKSILPSRVIGEWFSYLLLNPHVFSFMFFPSSSSSF